MIKGGLLHWEGDASVQQRRQALVGKNLSNTPDAMERQSFISICGLRY